MDALAEYGGDGIRPDYEADILRGGSMKETKVYCDHCGKEIDTFKEYPGITISLNHIDAYLVLCDKCLDDFIIIVEKFLRGVRNGQVHD